MTKTSKGKGVDLGQLQADFEAGQKAWQTSERALARAQEQRDKDRSAFQAADRALRDASRTVLG